MTLPADFQSLQVDFSFLAKTVNAVKHHKVLKASHESVWSMHYWNVAGAPCSLRKNRGKLENCSSQFLRISLSCNASANPECCWIPTRLAPALPSLQVQLTCLRVLHRPQLTLELTLPVQGQMDHISANPPFCQYRLFLSFFSMRSPPKTNRTFDHSLNNVTTWETHGGDIGSTNTQLIFKTRCSLHLQVKNDILNSEC